MGKPLYPRGFVGHSSDHLSPNAVYERRDGDEDITRLFYDHAQRKENTKTWEFRKQVIDCAINLFGKFPIWVGLQEHNRYLHGQNFAFFVDTLRYISGRQREVSTYNWLSLLEVKPSDDGERSIDENVERAVKEYQNPRARTREIISNWCARDGGFEDLLFTLFIMFGDEKVDQ